LTTGSGSKFPASNFILKFVQYTTPADPTTPVVKFEYVLVTNRSGDTLTVTRGFDGSTPASFLAGDFVYLTNHKEIIKDIQDEVTRLESDKLNKWGLRTALANTWRMFFSNGSNAETELTFGASGRVLTSNGSSSAPSWEVPTVNIPALTEDTTGSMEDDFFAKNNGIGANTRIKMTRYRATDGEVAAGTVTNKFVTPKQRRDYAPRTPWTTVTRYTLPAPVSVATTSYVLLASFTTTLWGIYKLNIQTFAINTGAWLDFYVDVAWVVPLSLSVSAGDFWGGLFHIPAWPWDVIAVYWKRKWGTSAWTLDLFTITSD